MNRIVLNGSLRHGKDNKSVFGEGGRRSFPVDPVLDRELLHATGQWVATKASVIAGRWQRDERQVSRVLADCCGDIFLLRARSILRLDYLELHLFEACLGECIDVNFSSEFLRDGE